MDARTRTWPRSARAGRDENDRREGLREARRIRNHVRYTRLNLADDLDTHGSREGAGVEYRRHHEVADARSLRRNGQLSGLDTRRIENGIDEVQEFEPALLDDGDALALAFAQDAAREEAGKTQNGVERCLQVVAHRGEKKPPHTLGRCTCVNGPLLGAGEFTKHPSELVGRVHQRRDRLKARVPSDAPAAKNVSDARGLKLMLGKRHVFREGSPRSPTKHRRDRNGHEREAYVHGRVPGLRRAVSNRAIA